MDRLSEEKIHSILSYLIIEKIIDYFRITNLVV